MSEKLEAIAFARLISYITAMRGNGSLDTYELGEIARLVKDIFPAVDTVYTKSPVDLVPLFDALKRNQKIVAIKEYRVLTGVGLKESKDAIEALYNSNLGITRTYPCANCEESGRM